MDGLRVLVLSHMYPREYYPAGGVFVQEQAKALIRRGASVAVLSGEPFWISTYDFRKVSRALQAYLEEPFRWRVREGVPIIYFPYCVGGYFRHPLHALSYWHGVRRVIEMIRARFPFDIVHAHTSFLDGYSAIKLGKKFGRKVVLTEHMGPFSLLTRNGILKHFTRKSVRSADRVLAVSHALKRDMLAELGSDAEQVQILGNGFDPQIFQLRTHPVRVHRPAQMLWLAGAGGEVKGGKRLVAAFAAALKQGASVELSVLGSPSVHREVAAEFEKLGGAAGAIHFLPMADRKGISAAISDHDFIVVASYKETFSLSGLESLACGRPVLTTTCGGPEDYVVSGHNGMIVGNTEGGLLDGILRMSQTYSGYDGRSIAEEVLQSRTWDAVAERLFHIYAELLLS